MPLLLSKGCWFRNFKESTYSSWWRSTVVERGLWLANFPCPALDLQLMGDH